LQTKREFRPKVSKPLTRFGNDSFSRPKRVFETLKVARTACLRLGESAECVERVEGTLEAEPGEVAEGDACYRRINPPQSPTQSIDWCGVVEPSIFALTGPLLWNFSRECPEWTERTCVVKRRCVFSIILWIVIIVVVLLALGYFARGRRR
jgi:hypothetical protein